MLRPHAVFQSGRRQSVVAFSFSRQHHVLTLFIRLLHMLSQRHVFKGRFGTLFNPVPSYTDILPATAKSHTPSARGVPLCCVPTDAPSLNVPLPRNLPLARFCHAYLLASKWSTSCAVSKRSQCQQAPFATESSYMPWSYVPCASSPPAPASPTLQ